MSNHQNISNNIDQNVIPIYAFHGTTEFNQRVNTILTELTDEFKQELKENLVALVLGGGYGRGEGAIIKVNGVEQPYNDVDLLVVVKRKQQVKQGRLAQLCKPFETNLGIHVDISRPVTAQDICHWPAWLLWKDLLNGHKVLFGREDILSAHAPAILARPLPIIEATKLLLNRGAGLLWALRVLRNIEPSPDPDFVRRNFYKCALALGDAILIAYQRFTTAYRGRDQLLANLSSEVDAVARLNLLPQYQRALAFKFSPDLVEGGINEVESQTLAAQWGTVFLHVENRRAGRDWQSLTAYCNARQLREPEQHLPIKLLRNLIQNRRFGSWSLRYPREQLYRQLPILLGLTNISNDRWPQTSAGFLEIWRKFN